MFLTDATLKLRRSRSALASRELPLRPARLRFAASGGRELRRGVVTLRGRVHTFHQKQLCLNCCQRVAGVLQIDDQIEVASPLP